MSFIELFLVALGLSMDAFAVAVSRGLTMKKRISYSHAYIIAGLFGGFQAVMPFIGWLAASYFESYILGIDHWIAFAMLSFIGIRMIYETFTEDKSSGGFNIKEIFFLAVATSIDALAVGITFAFLHVSILPSVLLIGVITFLLSLVGVVIGFRFGKGFKRKAEIAGGLILIAIGVKILVQHL